MNAEALFVLGDYLNPKQMKKIYGKLHHTLDSAKGKSKKKKVESIYSVSKDISGLYQLGAQISGKGGKLPMFNPVVLRNGLSDNEIEDIFDDYVTMVSNGLRGKKNVIKLFELGDKAMSLYKFTSWFPAQGPIAPMAPYVPLGGGGPGPLGGGGPGPLGGGGPGPRGGGGPGGPGGPGGFRGGFHPEHYRPPDGAPPGPPPGPAAEEKAEELTEEEARAREERRQQRRAERDARKAEMDKKHQEAFARQRERIAANKERNRLEKERLAKEREEFYRKKEERRARERQERKEKKARAQRKEEQMMDDSDSDDGGAGPAPKKKKKTKPVSPPSAIPTDPSNVGFGPPRDGAKFGDKKHSRQRAGDLNKALNSYNDSDDLATFIRNHAHLSGTLSGTVDAIPAGLDSDDTKNFKLRRGTIISYVYTIDGIARIGASEGVEEDGLSVSIRDLHFETKKRPDNKYTVKSAWYAGQDVDKGNVKDIVVLRSPSPKK